MEDGKTEGGKIVNGHVSQIIATGSLARLRYGWSGMFGLVKDNQGEDFLWKSSPKSGRGGDGNEG